MAEKLREMALRIAYITDDIGKRYATADVFLHKVDGGIDNIMIVEINGLAAAELTKIAHRGQKMVKQTGCVTQVFDALASLEGGQYLFEYAYAIAYAGV